jgi:stage III sporulation protein AA
MRLVDCLPTRLKCVSKYLDKLQQLRLVADCPVKLRIDGVNYYLSSCGLQKSSLGAICVTSCEISEFVKTACQNSIYAFEKQIANGYLTLDDGTRIGVAGKGCMASNGDMCFSDYTSVCIRVNRCVAGCSSGVDENLLNSSMLIVGMPGYGKTTFLRDLVVRASANFDVVVLDERGEITLANGFANKSFCDVLLHMDRSYSAPVAVKSLSPEIMACDEVTDKDTCWLRNALQSGVKVYATLHSSSFLSAKCFCDKNALNFDNYVILERFGGKMAKLYNKTGEYITL